jgi:hypothetical protein
LAISVPKQIGAIYDHNILIIRDYTKKGEWHGQRDLSIDSPNSTYTPYMTRKAAPETIERAGHAEARRQSLRNTKYSARSAEPHPESAGQEADVVK